MLEALQMRDVLTPDGEEWSEKWIPWPDNIKENGMEVYIRLIWEFQSVVEDRMEAVPNEKGCDRSRCFLYPLILLIFTS
ncbi:hypothetical protein PI126_g14162 [Phytophthora idaei]|nr:hypothetical protein PI126_g14162 [Phytophthora idaei]